MKQYEFMEVIGERRENGIHNFPVTVDQLNELGKVGWNYSHSNNDGFTVFVKREINSKNFSDFHKIVMAHGLVSEVLSITAIDSEKSDMLFKSQQFLKDYLSNS